MGKVKIVDLAVATDPEAMEPEKATFKRIYHEEGAEQAAKFFNLKKEDFKDGLLWANGSVTLGEHTGTHLDAPIHYAPMSEGKPSKTIDEIPLEWCYGDGVVLDFHEKETGYAIMEEDIKNQLKKINYRLKPMDIVLIRTDSDKYLYDERYFSIHPGMSAEATRYLCRQGIKVMGIDAWGWDIPFSKAVEKFKATGDNSVLWEGHLVGKEHEYCHIEKLANLKELPAYGFKVAAFPVKLKGGTAGWCRPVAIIEYK
ncbi:MAG: cyclase family protein [Maledivibacter sp.]|jgi:kynurenine formamidase|nr:cyclase family protein [Maledivibacter sp.]